MIFKVILVAAALTAAGARPQEGHGYGHGYSAQSFVVHHIPEHKHAPVYHNDHVHHEYHGHTSPSHSPEQHHGHVEHYAHPKYEFSYEVKDTHTHDIKQQHEHSDGDGVKGEYSVLQPDGKVRHVMYHADKKTGFHADVKYEGHAKPYIPEYHYHH